ncbi:MAG: tRNA lysidine(34) synthetase TilS [Dehalococcoidia bacterium]|nr:tRNA lysidine(34) synthetase TilS [Dehalococcoidia bacterium]
MSTEYTPATSRTPLERRVEKFITEKGLLAGHSRLMVGVSGGPDSVCLLHILARSRDKLGIYLHAAHLNHGLRGAESDADSAYVQELCGGLNVPVTAGKADMGPLRRKHSPLEETAREARYSFFTSVAGDIDARAVAIGHTADDHLETVLLHLLRGAGTRGLAGLEPVVVRRSGNSSLSVVRPLLEARRSETEGYCQRFDLRPRRDITNQSLHLLRNRIRLELLPLLRQYNAGFDAVLGRTSRIARDDLQALELWAAGMWTEVARNEGGSLHLDRNRLLTCPPGLRRVLVRRALEESLGGPRDIRAGHIESLMNALNMPAGKRLSLLQGLCAYTDYDGLVLGGSPPSPLPPLTTEYPLNVPGETVLPGWRVIARETDKDALEDTLPGPDALSAFLDYEKTGSQLVVRTRNNGDRFQPLGMEQHKKLQDFMVDARIPRAWRDGIPLVCAPDQILWVGGWRIDGRVRVTESTRKVLCLRFLREPEQR